MQLQFLSKHTAIFNSPHPQFFQECGVTLRVAIYDAERRATRPLCHATKSEILFDIIAYADGCLSDSNAVDSVPPFVVENDVSLLRTLFQELHHATALDGDCCDIVGRC